MDEVPENAISKTLKGATFPGPHWQKGFFDHGIRAEESYEQKWVYVRDNPVRAGLVRSAEDWPYAGEIARGHRPRLQPPASAESSVYEE